jgi:hypothetical protein
MKVGGQKSEVRAFFASLRETLTKPQREQLDASIEREH